jgi:hypothetical protein
MPLLSQLAGWLFRPMPWSKSLPIALMAGVMLFLTLYFYPSESVIGVALLAGLWFALVAAVWEIVAWFKRSGGRFPDPG